MPLAGVEFEIRHANGRFVTDGQGRIDLSHLAPGRYTIRKTRPAPGCSRNDVPRTVEFITGRVTEIVWENTPITGQLQIRKVSGDANYHNGLPADFFWRDVLPVNAVRADRLITGTYNHTLHFWQVPAGFTSVERPRIYVDVLSEHQAFLSNSMIA